MPLPKTKDVGKIVRFLKEENPNMDKKQRIAIALSHSGKSKYSKDDVKVASRIYRNRK